MTILAKLTGEKKDLEKVPLPLHLNDESMMHHGSLMSVSCNAIPFSPAFNLRNQTCPCEPLYPVSFALLQRHKFRFRFLLAPVCVCV